MAARSPSGERRTPADRLALALNFGRNEERKRMARVFRGAADTLFCCSASHALHRSEMDDSRRVGLDSTQVGRQNVGLGLCCLLELSVGRGTGRFSVLGRISISF
jgi:hypothetical protein